jgi:hypothetical protein
MNGHPCRYQLHLSMNYECRLRAISGWLRLRRSREVNYQKVGPACVHP